ncbi:MAG: protein-disulfide reductase DsbD family protein [Alphaproteobacteria bacterium]
MKNITALFTFALILFGLPDISHAQEAEKEAGNLVQINLLAEKGQVSGGDEIWIGIEQSIAPHWHTYWINPGDSGTALTASWNLPAGFEITDIQWPTPKKIPYGPLLNYGYEGNVTLLQKLKTPQNIPEGEITLTADIELLVCKDECIPEYGTYTLTLNGENAASQDNSAAFTRAKAALPKPAPQSATFTFTENEGNLALSITGLNAQNATFFPTDWGIIENAAPQTITKKGDTYTLSQKRGERSLNSIKTLNGILATNNNAYTINATPNIAAAKDVQTKNTPKKSGITIPGALLFAVLGGLILNLMPCVFPVLSIKAISLVKLSDEAPIKAKIHGLAYTAGVILSFLAIAGILLILKSAGAGIGWGFQLQNPIVVGGLATLLFAIGLNLSGYFEFGKSISIGNKLTQNQGASGSFFTGILATAVATPCTAPFMAGAIGFALTQNAFISLLIFAALGLGLALPFLALSFIPSLQKSLPRPGAWMDVFKQLLAFPMFLSAIWLTWVLTKQAGSGALLQILLAMAALTFGIWLLKFKKAYTKILALIMFATTLGLISVQTTTQTQTTKLETKTDAYTPAHLKTLLSGDQPIFVEMTADWCITCKVNAAIGIDTNKTRNAFATHNVHYIVGDWTNKDATITTYLEQHDRNGVPLYVYYGPRNENGDRPEGKILPQILTPNTIPNLFK